MRQKDECMRTDGCAGWTVQHNLPCHPCLCSSNRNFKESDHHLSSNLDCSNTADVPSFTRRMARSAMPFFSDRWGVEVRWFHDRSSQDFPKSNEVSLQNIFGFVDGYRNFRKHFCITRTRLNPSCGKILNHYSVSVIVPWFTSLIEDLEISRYQVTKLFLLEVELRQCVFCKEQLSFLFASRYRNFGFWWSEYKYCASLMPLS